MRKVLDKYVGFKNQSGANKLGILNKINYLGKNRTVDIFKFFNSLRIDCKKEWEIFLFKK